MIRKNLFAQIIGISLVLILFVSVVLGGTSYWFAKKELLTSGRLDLKHIAEASIPLLEEYNEQVENGTLTLEEAKEKARIKLTGPKVEGNEKLFYDFSKSPFKYKEAGYIFAYDSSLKVELHPVLPLGKDMSKVQDQDGDFMVKDLFEASKRENAEDRYYEFAWPKAGDTKASNKIAYTVYFEPWDWSIMIGAYEDEFYQSINTVGYITAGISIFTLIFAAVLIYLLMRKKINALKTVTGSAIEFAGGNLEVEAIKYKGADEVGQMAEAFNKMTDQLRNLISNIQRVGKQTSHSALELSALSEETTASSEEIGRAISEITKGAVSQAADIDSVNHGTESLSGKMKELTVQNGRIMELTESSKQAVGNGKTQVFSLQNANQASKGALENIDRSVSQLNHRVGDIANIVTTIKEIADQTNLLALNASIEAARAGEQGKGFAVVAGEVRKLAEATNRATNEIQQMIQTIRLETSASVKEMEATKVISEQLNVAVSDTEQEFNKISSTIGNIVVAINDSSQLINEISDSIGQLVTGIQSVSAVSEQTSAASQQVMASVHEQVSAISTISKQADSLSELSEELSELISKFKL